MAGKRFAETGELCEVCLEEGRGERPAIVASRDGAYCRSCKPPRLIICRKPTTYHGISGLQGCGSDQVVVTVRLANFSTFSGRRWTPSDYSELRCLTCGRFWRSRAPGVALLRDATEAEALA